MRAMHRALAFLLLLITLPSLAAAADPATIRIATGNSSGTYHALGGAICGLFNANQPPRGERCVVRSSRGSVENIGTLRTGGVQLAVVQSDVEAWSYRGIGPFAEPGPFTGLRALFSAQAESFTVLVRTDSGIERLEDLKHKVVDVGLPGSGRLHTAMRILGALGWTRRDFVRLSQLNPQAAVRALCRGSVNAVVLIVTHPNAWVRDAANTCAIRLLDVNESAVNRLVEHHPYYAKETIPPGLYRGVSRETVTFGTVATVVTTDTLPEATAYALTRSMFSQLDTLRKLDPTFEGLNEAAMATQGTVAPRHPGAERYFREAGLIK
jgi:uncharacterized protein